MKSIKAWRKMKLLSNPCPEFHSFPPSPFSYPGGRLSPIRFTSRTGAKAEERGGGGRDSVFYEVRGIKTWEIVGSRQRRRSRESIANSAAFNYCCRVLKNIVGHLKKED